MTFGKVKTIIENNLIDSYKNEKEFKKSLREFKHNVLENKNLSKIYSLYDQLSDSQGLSEEDAKEFIQEGVQLIQKLLQNVKLPITLKESSNNSYSDIDTLVYDTKINLKERIEAKKNLIKVLTSKKEKVKESINIPIKSMVSIANQTLNTFISSLDETAKKEFFAIVSEDTKSLEDKFEILKENTIEKLNSILDKEEEFEVKTKISETIDRIKGEKFDQINFLKLKSLEGSI
jgi:hypothetical protein